MVASQQCISQRPCTPRFWRWYHSSRRTRCSMASSPLLMESPRRLDGFLIPMFAPSSSLCWLRAARMPATYRSHFRVEHRAIPSTSRTAIKAAHRRHCNILPTVALRTRSRAMVSRRALAARVANNSRKEPWAISSLSRSKRTHNCSNVSVGGMSAC
jgi:hypothetical protein